VGTCTYVHFGRNAESTMAPDRPRPFPLKYASVMEVSMVTGLLSLRSPLNVNCDMALLSKRIEDIGGISLGYQEGIWGIEPFVMGLLTCTWGGRPQ
jgi:hypothetical protein